LHDEEELKEGGVSVAPEVVVKQISGNAHPAHAEKYLSNCNAVDLPMSRRLRS
jgi:hypothetical protein